jgi:hypothetical protein
MSSRLLVISLLALVAVTAEARAQDDRPSVTIAIQRIAPGQHLAFLEYMAAQEAAAVEAGAPASQWYVHQDGDAWDYIVIAPEISDEVQDRVDAALEQRGLKTGFQGGLEFRRYIAHHTDTQAWGPTTVQEVLAAAKE